MAAEILMHYHHSHGICKHLQNDAHAGIACDFCVRSEWKGARLMSSIFFLLRTVLIIIHLFYPHEFLKILDPLYPKEFPAASVTISPILPTKVELLALLKEEERPRFSPEIQ